MTQYDPSLFINKERWFLIVVLTFTLKSLSCPDIFLAHGSEGQEQEEEEELKAPVTSFYLVFGYLTDWNQSLGPFRIFIIST